MPVSSLISCVITTMYRVRLRMRQTTKVAHADKQNHREAGTCLTEWCYFRRIVTMIDSNLYKTAQHESLNMSSNGFMGQTRWSNTILYVAHIRPTSVCSPWYSMDPHSRKQSWHWSHRIISHYFLAKGYSNTSCSSWFHFWVWVQPLLYTALSDKNKLDPLQNSTT